MLTGPTRLCRPCLPAEPTHAAATAGFSILEGEIPGETDCLLEGTRFELPVRGCGRSGCRPFYAAESSGRVGASSQFSDSTTTCIQAAWTRPPRPQSVPATHSAEFCLVREETATLYRVTATADPVLVHGNRLGGAKGPQPVPLHRRLEIRSGR